MTKDSWALIVPMANEEKWFSEFINAVNSVLLTHPNGHVYIVIDNATNDKTALLAKQLVVINPNFTLLNLPVNKNVVDAYLGGFKEAYKNGHTYFIEIDAGMSHNPSSIPFFLEELKSGVNCVFGSRNLNGSSTQKVGIQRKFLSWSGTKLSNLFLGSNLSDMTSGYQGFSREVMFLITNYQFKSTGHFYQTELKYILRKYSCKEIPIHYQDPSPSVSIKSIVNSLSTLLYYTKLRLIFKPVYL